MEKILLHACCGICSGYPITYLKNLGYEVIVYFTNNNLDTQEEYNRRLEAEKTLCEHLKVELLTEDYNHKIFKTVVNGFENEPEGGKRCLKCFEMRFEDTVKKAIELNINKITTSMIISPHKNFKLLAETGQAVAKKYNKEFLAIDFKKKDGFLKTNKISKELNLYRQNYCGCEYAKERR